MSNKYRLEGEARSLSLGGIGRVLTNLVVIVAAIYIVLQIDSWNKTKEAEITRSKEFNELIRLTESDRNSLGSFQTLGNHQMMLFELLMETANRQVASDTLRMAIKQLLKTDDHISSLQSSVNLKTSLSDKSKQNLAQVGHQTLQLSQSLDIQQRLIEDKLETFLLRKQVLSLIEPFEDLEEVSISEVQVDRIIRVLLNDREFIDLIYLRISRLQIVMKTSEALNTSLMVLRDNLRIELNKTQD